MAEALLVIKIDSEGNLTVVRQATKEVEGLGKASGDTSKGGMEQLVQKAKLVGGAMLAWKVAQKGAELTKLGAQSLAASDRLDAFAGGSERAQEMLDALSSSTDYTIDRMTATAHASRLMQMEMVRNRDEMELTGAIVGKLGDQTQSVESRMQTWTMLMANQSTLRLDTFGLSVERVEARIKDLEEAGYSNQEAFRTAVYEEGADALAILGDTSDSAATQIGRAEAAGRTFVQVLGESLTEAVEASGGLEIYTDALEGLTEAADRSAEAADRAYEKVVKLGGAGMMPGDPEAMKRLKLAYLEANGAAQNWQEDEDELRKALEAEAEAARESARAAEENATASEQAEEALGRQIDLAIRITQIEQRRSEAYARLYEREQDLAERHQERLNEIYMAGEQSRTEVVREEYQARLAALNEQFAREEEAYQARRAAERYADELEEIERNHQERVQEIRDQYRETERQAEDRRYREALDALEESQQERLRILRGESAGGGFESRREDLAREHEERMAGLYSDAAREREQERYEEELAKIDQEEAEYELLQQFEREKEDLESQHQDNLQEIREREVEDQLQREEERYRGERALAEERERERQQELARRRDREQKEAEARRQIEEWYQGELSEIQRIEQAERIAQENRDYARELEQLSRSRADIETTYNESMNRLVMQEMEGNQERRLAYAQANDLILEETLQWQERMNSILSQTAQLSLETWQTVLDAQQLPNVHWEDYVPQYQHGTSYHPGGAAIVGDGDTRGELVLLPRGSQVFDAPTTAGMMGGGGPSLIIHNHFGRDSVRDDRDIYQISKDQEMAYRRRGVRTFNTT